MSKIPPPRRGRGLLIALGLFVFLGVIALVAHLTTRPWLARPEDDAKKIERRFREVRKWGEVRVGAVGKDDALVGAAHLASEWTSKPGKGGFPQLDKDKLPKNYREAVNGLVKWTRGQGRFRSAGCLSPTGEVIALPAASASAPAAPSATAPAEKGNAEASEGKRPHAEDYYRLGRLALETTLKDRRVPVRARGVMKLAHLMRSQGNLEEYVAGLKLSRDAALWLKSRKQNPDVAFQSYRPRVNQLRGALARSAVCSVALVEGLEGWHFDVGTRFPGATSGPPLGLVSYDREALVLKDFHSRVLHETRATQTIPELVQAYTQAERPRSVVLEVTLPDQALFEQIAKLHAEYDELVPSSRQGSTRTRAPRAHRPRSPRSRARSE